MLTTEQIRREWAELRCNTAGCFAIPLGDQGARILVHPDNVVVWRWFDQAVRRHRYRVRAADTGSYNCRSITGGTRPSLHAFPGVAVDVNWRSNPYGTRLVTDLPPALIAEVRGLRTRTGHRVLRWGGDFTSVKDAMHFEIVCTRAQLRSGLSIPAVTPAPPASTPALALQEDDMPVMKWSVDKRCAWLVTFGGGFPGRRILVHGWKAVEWICREITGQKFTSPEQFRRDYGVLEVELQGVTDPVTSGNAVERIKTVWGGR